MESLLIKEMADGQRFYTQDEVEGILRLASQSNGTTGVTHDQLIQIASEVGLTPEQVAVAERNYAAHQIKEQTLAQDLELRAQFRSELKARAFKKLIGLFSMSFILLFVIGRHGSPVFPILMVLLAVTFIKKLLPLFSKDTFESKFLAWKSGQLTDEEEFPQPRVRRDGFAR